MAAILPSIFILKEGLANVTLLFVLYLYPCFRNIIFFWLELIKTTKVSIFLIIFFLYTAYAYDTTFFLENKESIEELVKTFTLFSSILGLSPNISKYEICGLGPLKMGGNDSLQYANSWFNKRHYKDIRYLHLVQHKINESKKLLWSYS